MSAFHALVDTGSVLSLYSVTSFSGPVYKFSATPLVNVSRSPNVSKFVMLGEPDQVMERCVLCETSHLKKFDRAFIFSASDGMQVWEGSTNRLQNITTPFTISTALAGCRNQQNLEYYFLFFDENSKVKLWRFQPPTIGSSYSFAQVSLDPLMASIPYGSVVTRQCAMDANQLLLQVAVKDMGLYTFDLRLNKTTLAKKFPQHVIAMGNSISQSAYGLVAGSNQPTSYGRIDANFDVDYTAIVPSVMTQVRATGPVADLTPAFTQSDGYLVYATSREGPLVSVAFTSFNGNNYLDITSLVVSGLPDGATYVALSN